MLTERQVKAVEKKVQPKKTTLKILETQLVKNGYVYFTDLEFSGRHKTDLPDGLYLNGEKCTDLTVDDFQWNKHLKEI